MNFFKVIFIFPSLLNDSLDLDGSWGWELFFLSILKTFSIILWVKYCHWEVCCPSNYYLSTKNHILYFVFDFCIHQGASLVAQGLKRLPTMWVTWVWSLGWEDPLGKEMATHSSILAWRIPWTEEPGGLQSTGSQRVGHDWATSLSFTFIFSSFTIICLVIDFLIYSTWTVCLFKNIVNQVCPVLDSFPFMHTQFFSSKNSIRHLWWL